MCVDYITGVMSAIACKKLNSKTSFLGIAKKFSYILLVIVSVYLDQLLGMDGISRLAVTSFLIATDGISILENVGEMGVPYPKFLKQILSQLKDKANKGDEQEYEEVEMESDSESTE